MTYYRSTEYDGHNRYIIPFLDIDGNEWQILIQDPTFTGTATQLTGAPTPVEWTGDGDEDQTNVIHGTTGLLRLICQPGQESIFTFGALFPENINDRRVLVMRMTTHGSGTTDWTPYWQGFIKPEQYTQDWNSAPYEIELPIVSALAATEYFTMPMPSDDDYAAFNSQTDIAGLFRCIIRAIGCQVLAMYTNYTNYEDFNGEKSVVVGSSPTQYHHWTQGTISASFFYEMQDGIMKPKTFKDVLENICNPYGKISECYRGWAFMMYWKADTASGARLYKLDMYSNYSNQTLATANRFTEDTPTRVISLSNITPAGTDNTYSLITRPKSVTFTKNIETSKDIFELSDKFISPSLPIGDNLLSIKDPSGLYSLVQVYNFNAKRRYVYVFSKSYVNTDFGLTWRYSSETPVPTTLQDFIFCRVVEATGETYNASYNVPVPLGFCFNMNQPTWTTPYHYASIAFTLQQGIRTKNGYNILKLSLKSYLFEQEDPYAYGQDEYYQITTAIFVDIYDENTQLHLNMPSQGAAMSWTSQAQDIPVGWFSYEGSEFVLWFNEYRNTGDNSLHKLRFLFKTATKTAVTGYGLGRMFTTFKLEYTKSKIATEDNAAATFAESIEKNGNTINCGGNGDSLDINFKTQCGTKNVIIDGSCLMPYNSFSNSQAYIDTQNREQIEMEAAKFQRYTIGGQTFDIVNYPVSVTDGSKVYMPVAVGMNPRDNIVHLRLVSTNVTAPSS